MLSTSHNQEWENPSKVYWLTQSTLDLHLPRKFLSSFVGDINKFVLPSFFCYGTRFTFFSLCISRSGFLGKTLWAGKSISLYLSNQCSCWFPRKNLSRVSLLNTPHLSFQTLDYDMLWAQWRAKSTNIPCLHESLINKRRKIIFHFQNPKPRSKVFNFVSF